MFGGSSLNESGRVRTRRGGEERHSRSSSGRLVRDDDARLVRGPGFEPSSSIVMVVVVTKKAGVRDGCT